MATCNCSDEVKRDALQQIWARGYAPMLSRPILCTPSGGQMGTRYNADLMPKERKRLGLEAFDLHALRYRGMMALAGAGCSDDEIASYSGHETKAMIAKYSGEGRRVMRARQARAKRQRTKQKRNMKLIPYEQAQG